MMRGFELSKLEAVRGLTLTSAGNIKKKTEAEGELKRLLVSGMSADKV